MLDYLINFESEIEQEELEPTIINVFSMDSNNITFTCEKTINLQHENNPSVSHLLTFTSSQISDDILLNQLYNTFLSIIKTHSVLYLTITQQIEDNDPTIIVSHLKVRDIRLSCSNALEARNMPSVRNYKNILNIYFYEE